MNSDKQKRLIELFAAKTDDSITANEHEELQQFLRSDAIARRMWFLHKDIEGSPLEMDRLPIFLRSPARIASLLRRER